jgi:hypothetical protein
VPGSNPIAIVIAIAIAIAAAVRGRQASACRKAPHEPGHWQKTNASLRMDAFLAKIRRGWEHITILQQLSCAALRHIRKRLCA